jgi:hypothetical protein
MAEPAEPLRSTRAVDTEQSDSGTEVVATRPGGFYWGSDFIGFAVALFFTIVFFGIVGAVVGTVGYQMGAPVPKVGGPISNTTQTLGIGGLVGGLIALFLAYLIGGYTAGRMARFDGARNGVGVVIWTVIVAIVLGIVGGVLGNRFNVASQIHLNINTSTLTRAGVISLAVTLIVMLIASIIGGIMGANFHRRLDRDAGIVYDR